VEDSADTGIVTIICNNITSWRYY